MTIPESRLVGASVFTRALIAVVLAGTCAWGCSSTTNSGPGDVPGLGSSGAAASSGSSGTSGTSGSSGTSGNPGTGDCSASNPNAKTAAHGFICLGEGDHCDGTTLPCCSDECSDNQARPHDPTQTLVCDTQRGHPAATGNCTAAATPGGDAADPCGLLTWAQVNNGSISFSVMGATMVPPCSGGASSDSYYHELFVPIAKYSNVTGVQTWTSTLGDCSPGVCMYSLDLTTCIMTDGNGVSCKPLSKYDLKAKTCLQLENASLTLDPLVCECKLTFMPAGCTFHGGS